ncbi:UDP-glucose 4-epimerase GalE [Aureimonas fodinaquatilis]|uniref:UDP-glucose 4-epimerase n=1 Tax=Aureimonas fodinaquatilis TaxID=2565783 RepID=A0A5B0DZ75_9HYPH|nr:UDP-glucose 4-epimerase GalE [Aureimonas fodinaquatilis]KAA0972104.1 UDP-glucose 4-epimerase GalE [Aureimonas fodinaquatilis]
MSVLVTGGAGYIGSHMVLGLLDRGEEVVVLDNLSTGFDFCIASQAHFVQGDIGDTALVARLLKEHKVTAIAHFAASLLVAESVREPLTYYANNTARTRDLIEVALRADVPHFLFSSTAAVYGMAGDKPVQENAPLNPLSPYGRSKLMSEHMLADVSEAHGLAYAALRYFNVAGADPQGRSGESTFNSTHLVKIAMETVLGKRPGMQIFGTDYPTPDGTAIRDYIHVTDLIAAHMAALDYLRAGKGNLTANVGYGRGFSVRQVLDVVEQATGLPLNVAEGPRRAGDPASIVADSGYLRQATGWEPQYDDLPAIAEHAFAWEQYLSRRNR